MSVLLDSRQVDPYYVEFVFSTQNTALIDPYLDSTVAQFRAESFETFIITEKQGEHFLVSCIAVYPKGTSSSSPPRVVSQEARIKVQDQVHIQAQQASRHEPLSVSFGGGVGLGAKPTALRSLKDLH